MALIDGIVSYYKCEDDAANTTVTDELTTNDGTSSTNTSNLSVVGKILDGFSFLRTSSERIDLGSDSSLNITDHITISLWVKSGGTSGEHQMLVAKDGGTASTSQYRIVLMTTGYIYCDFKNHLANAMSPSDGYDDDAWHHVAMTASTDDNISHLYIDGSLVDSGTVSTQTTGVNAFISSRSNGYGDVDGELDEISIWNRHLTTAEIEFLYASGSPGSGQQYPFATGTNSKINIGDAWKDINKIQINIGDAWKEVNKVQINIGDAWKTIF